MKQWDGFQGGAWEKEINVRDFIQQNVTVYTGDDAFLAPATDATNQLWKQVMDLSKQERDNGGVLDMDTEVVSTITSHGPGYLNKDLETVVGVQTDKPFKRSLQPFGGIRMAEQACESYGFKVSEEVSRIFSDIRKTHNQGVFDAYTDEMKLARKAAIITGLPDAYGRGRIIGDYRRVALYGIDHLIAEKKKDLSNTGLRTLSDDIIRLREELNEQIRALSELKKLGKAYGFDLSQPAQTAKEAFQWLYLGYLAAIKEQNGAAMSLGRTSTFLDIYVERDLKAGVMTEQQAQELVDHFVMNSGIQRAVQRRPHLGNRVHRRCRHGWPSAGHQELLPLPAHPRQPGPVPGAEPDCALVDTSA
jgi:formate C-acetyltransferase